MIRSAKRPDDLSSSTAARVVTTRHERESDRSRNTVAFVTVDLVDAATDVRDDEIQGHALDDSLGGSGVRGYDVDDA